MFISVNNRGAPTYRFRTGVHNEPLSLAALRADPIPPEGPPAPPGHNTPLYT